MTEERTTLWKALMQAKCPRCRRGEVYKKGGIWKKMYPQCSHCNLYYERHPGYFYTAMYVSYALSVAELTALAIAILVLSGGSDSIPLYLGIIIPSILFLAPVNYKYSRVIQMYFLDPGLKYNPKYDRSFLSESREDS